MKSIWRGLCFLTLMGVSVAWGSDVNLVVIDNKLVKVESVVAPKVVITLPTTPAELGEIMILDAKLSGELPKFVKKKTYKWTVTDNGYTKHYWQEGSKVVFGTGIKPTIVKVALSLDLVYNVSGEEITKNLKHTVELKVGDSQPQTQPTKPVQNDMTEFAREVKTIFLSKTQSFDPTLRVKIAKLLAKSFQEASTEVDSEACKTPRGLMSYTYKKHSEAMTKENIPVYVSHPFWNEFQTSVYTKYSDSPTRSNIDYGAMFSAIADELNSIDQ